MTFSSATLALTKRVEDNESGRGGGRADTN